MPCALACERRRHASSNLSFLHLDATVNTVKFRAGNSPSTVDEALPGRVEYSPVMLESGITENRAFEDWANALVHHDAVKGPRQTDPNFRRDVEVVVLDLDRRPVLKYVLYRAWVSKFTAMSDLAADGNDVLIETLEITHEGFTREDV